MGNSSFLLKQNIFRLKHDKATVLKENNTLR